MTDEEINIAYEEAYIAACESDSPNSPDFETILSIECAKRGLDISE